MSKNLLVMTDRIKSARWAFDCWSWMPSHTQLSVCVSAIQPEEKDRVGRFVFAKDAKSALIGRLLIRKFVNESTGIPWDEIALKRDPNGKPYLDDRIQFNVSHNGRFAVLAGEVGNSELGVDVMKREYTGGKSVGEFFRIMNRHFSADEWSAIARRHGDRRQIETFFRLWCLKESYVKATGTGITVDLREISFRMKSEIEFGAPFVEDTELYLAGKKETGWVFQEALLDRDHCVAVALNTTTRDTTPDRFVILEFDELMRHCMQVIPPDDDYCAEFLSKE